MCPVNGSRVIAYTPLAVLGAVLRFESTCMLGAGASRGYMVWSQMCEPGGSAPLKSIIKPLLANVLPLAGAQLRNVYIKCGTIASMRLQAPSCCRTCVARLIG